MMTPVAPECGLTAAEISVVMKHLKNSNYENMVALSYRGDSVGVMVPATAITGYCNDGVKVATHLSGVKSYDELDQAEKMGIQFANPPLGVLDDEVDTMDVFKMVYPWCLADCNDLLTQNYIDPSSDSFVFAMWVGRGFGGMDPGDYLYSVVVDAQDDGIWTASKLCSRGFMIDYEYHGSLAALQIP